MLRDERMRGDSLNSNRDARCRQGQGGACIGQWAFALQQKLIDRISLSMQGNRAKVVDTAAIPERSHSSGIDEKPK